REKVDVVLFGGDVAWGPFPHETIDLARSLPNAEFIRGNADELSNVPFDDRRAFVVERLDGERIEWLESLQFSWSADDTLYVHANPRETKTPYFEWSQEDVLATALDGFAA